MHSTNLSYAKETPLEEWLINLQVTEAIFLQANRSKISLY